MPGKLLPDILAPLHIFRYDGLRKDGIDNEIYSENSSCAGHADPVADRVPVQAGAQAFLHYLCAGFSPVCRGRHLLLHPRLRVERLYRTGDRVSGLALRIADAGSKAPGVVYRHADAAEGEDLRIKRKHRKHKSAQARPASFLLGGNMATTRIIPMHLNKGKTLAQCLADRTEYGMNPDKTDGGELISSFACEPETVVSEFALSKREYRELTGRVQESDIIAYQIRQSFKPGEVSPEEANRIGYEFAERFLKGNHAFIVCTHTDKSHIHNHIYWNSTTLDCTRKFSNFIGSYRAVRKLSDLICAEHRLSVIENPQKHGLSYNKWLGGHDKLTNRDLLRMAIDAALEKQPKDFDALLALLKSSGYTVSRKGRLSLRHENQKKSIRLDSLGEGYSEQELRAVLAGGKTHNPFVKKKYPKRKERTTLISEIEAKLNSGKGYWYDQKMKVVKLKQMAKTFVYLEEQGFADFAALANAASAAEERFNELKASIKAAETRMSEIQTMRTHIINYSKTREVYAGYRKAGYSKKYLSEHESDIILHKAAKKAFDDFGLKKLPTVKSLNEEFARLLTEKKAAYADYHKTQEQMRELLIHKANAAYLLGLEERKQQIIERQREEK